MAGLDKAQDTFPAIINTGNIKPERVILVAPLVPCFHPKALSGSPSVGRLPDTVDVKMLVGFINIDVVVLIQALKEIVADSIEFRLRQEMNIENVLHFGQNGKKKYVERQVK
jgi:hypothetical protein